MFMDNSVLITKNDQKDLIGLRISAGLLIAMGCLIGLYVPFFVLMLGVSVVRHLHGHPPATDKPNWFLNVSIAICTASALTYLCFRAAAGLYNARRWAAYVAIGFGLLLLWVSGMFIYDWFHPERQGPDEYFGILIVPIFVALGLWWCIYLNLPYVRAHFKNMRKH
jgi:hypothetical protein